MLEIIKEFSNRGHQNILLTTDNGRKAYKAYLPADTKVTYKIIKSFRAEQRLGVFLSYLHRIYLENQLLRTLHINDEDLIICHSDFFPNSIANRKMLNINRRAHSAAFLHMLAPSIIRGYEGEYTGRLQFPRLTIIHYRLNQWLYKKLMQKQTVIFTVNLIYEKYLKKNYPSNKVKVILSFGGASSINHKLKVRRKKYDIVWVGRFHAQKGLKDFIHIVKEVSLHIPEVKVAILGGGDYRILKTVRQEIKRLGIQQNIEFAGFVTGDEKYDYISKSKIFAMTSHYESFGLVILEAMSVGLPIVAYGLPVFSIYGNGIIRVPTLQTKLFATETLKLLNDRKAYKLASNNARQVANTHSWTSTADEMLTILGLQNSEGSIKNV